MRVGEEALVQPGDSPQMFALLCRRPYPTTVSQVHHVRSSSGIHFLRLCTWHCTESSPLQRQRLGGGQSNERPTDQSSTSFQHSPSYAEWPHTPPTRCRDLCALGQPSYSSAKTPARPRSARARYRSVGQAQAVPTPGRIPMRFGRKLPGSLGC